MRRLRQSYTVSNSILDKPVRYKCLSPPPLLHGPILFTGFSTTNKSYHAHEISKKIHFEYLDTLDYNNNNVILDVCPSILSVDQMNKIPLVIHLDDDTIYNNTVYFHAMALLCFYMNFDVVFMAVYWINLQF